MAEKKYMIKTVKETDAVAFDETVNALIEQGYWLQKTKVVATEDDVYFIAFMDKTIKIEVAEEMTEQPLK